MRVLIQTFNGTLAREQRNEPADGIEMPSAGWKKRSELRSAVIRAAYF